MSFRIEYKSIKAYTSENITGDGLPDLDIGYYSSIPQPDGTIEFPETDFNTSASSEAYLRVDNLGTSQIDIVGINFNPLVSEFSVASTNYSVAADGTIYIPFTFSPTENGIFSTNVQVVVENAVNGSFFNYIITGVGVIAELDTEYPNGYTINFGEFPVEETRTMNLTITNSGLGNMVFDVMEFNGFGASAYSLDGGIPPLPFILSAEQSIEFSIICDPDGVFGFKNAVFDLSSNVGTLYYPLTALATQITYISTPLPLSTLSGDIPLSGATFPISIYNDGNKDLILSGSDLSSNHNDWITLPSYPIYIPGGVTNIYNLGIFPDETIDLDDSIYGFFTINTNIGTYTYYLSSEFVDGDFLALSSDDIFVTDEDDLIKLT